MKNVAPFLFASYLVEISQLFLLQLVDMFDFVLYLFF